MTDANVNVMDKDKISDKIQELHTKTTLLYAEVVAKGNLYNAIHDRHQARRRELQKVYDEYITAALRIEFGTDLEVANAAYEKAKFEHNDAVNAFDVYKAMEKLPFPEGTKMVEWNKVYSISGDSVPTTKTGQVGLFQIFREGDPIPNNMRGMRLPFVGSFIIRYLKKDAKTGLKFELFGDSYLKLWTPEGVDPNIKT